MRKLKNWDNQTWLSSKKYIQNFSQFLKKKMKFKKNTRILDIGCGRANIISYLQKKYRFKNKPVGIDVVRNNNLKRNIIFKRTDGIKFLKKDKNFYDLILIKQTIHFFSKTKLNHLLNLVKKRLSSKGKVLIFTLKTKDNEIPCFKKMKNKLEKSLKRDEFLLKSIKQVLRIIILTKFNFNVEISSSKYSKMIQKRYISCLLNFSKKDINKGIKEIKKNYSNLIKFNDALLCIEYEKK